MRIMVKTLGSSPWSGTRRDTVLPKFIYYPERLARVTVATFLEHAGVPRMSDGYAWVLRIPLLVGFLLQVYEHGLSGLSHNTSVIVMLVLLILVKSLGNNREEE